MFGGSLKVTLILGAIILALGGTTAWSLSQWGESRAEVRAERVHVQELQGQLRALQERTERIQAQAQESQRRSRELSQEIEDALEQEQDWSRGPVPGAVRDSLCSGIECR